jgi:DNA-binding transcriptional LysR family regulator
MNKKLATSRQNARGHLRTETAIRERGDIGGSERWAALEIRLMTAFVAVVEHRSFTGAARQLGYTQSGISQQVAALERIVDRRLLVRQYGRRLPVELTTAGAALLEHCRVVLRQIDRAYAEIVQGEVMESAVRVGAFSSAAVHLLPPLRRALQTHDDLRLELIEGQTDYQMFSQLDTGAAELAFAALPVPERFAAERIGIDPYLAMVSSASPLATDNPLRLSTLKGHTLLGITRCEHEDAVAAQLSGYGVDTSTFERYDDNRLIQSLAGAGSGVAIVPSLTIDRTDESVTILNIPAELPPRTIALVYPRDAPLSPAALRFKEIALPLCKDILARLAQLAMKPAEDVRPAGSLRRRGKLSAA